MILKVNNRQGATLRSIPLKFTDDLDQKVSELYDKYPRHKEDANGWQDTNHKIYLHIRSGDISPNSLKGATIKDFKF